jgi:glycosyltransferase involved in cell wall biosynthesis
LLYRVVLPRADHIFVQSRQMQLDIASHGIPMSQMTPVPMGVDTELAQPEEIVAAQDSRLAGKRIVAYLGTLDRVRQIEILFHMLAIVRQTIPDILLLLVGDTEDAAHRNWLKQEAERAGVSKHVLWTGWLPAAQAWGYVRRTELGLSPIPRGYLLDMGSPTKAVEYMALGVPVIANDNPDQAQVIAESGGGLCVPFQAEAFAQGVVRLLAEPQSMRQMGAQGRSYVADVRGYDSIATRVASAYRLVVGP